MHCKGLLLGREADLHYQQFLQVKSISLSSIDIQTLCKSVITSSSMGEGHPAELLASHSVRSQFSIPFIHVRHPLPGAQWRASAAVVAKTKVGSHLL